MGHSESLPLTEKTFFILLSLAPEARHGYGIMQDVESISNGRVELSTGTLYGALRRLLKDGWIERVPEGQQPEVTDGRNQKYYRLTAAGKEMLKDELERLKQLISLGDLRKSDLSA